MAKKLLRKLQLLTCLVLIIQLSSCGLLLHPERKGQKQGRIDASIAVLDGIGLLFFVIPGVIAFAVDFYSGTIYLPRGRKRSALDFNDIRQVRFDPENYDNSTIENLVEKETGFAIRLNQKNLQVSKLKSMEDLKIHFADISKSTGRFRVVSAKEY